MIVSVRHWTSLRPVRRVLRALAPKAPAKNREEKDSSRGFLGQFEAMMVHQTGLALRSFDKN